MVNLYKYEDLSTLPMALIELADGPEFEIIPLGKKVIISAHIRFGLWYEILYVDIRNV